MIQEKKVLAIIPARGGSKTVPRKNIREIGGKPLIAWTIEEAKKSIYIDRLILSSEDDEIISIAQQWGCEVAFKRPIELAQDDTPGIAPVLHALSQLPIYDYIVLLQPTSPLRKVIDIDACLEACVKTHSYSSVSVTESDSSPYWMYTVDKSGKMQPFIKTPNIFERRQDLPKVYLLNGAVYVAQTAWLLQNKNFISEDTTAYIMPLERSLDIDTEFDLLWMQNHIKHS
ncbi:acylneuraminate cytidylyltransferase family protein [Nostoc sp. 106C]|uniref:acylneuraminate cytidylyltransferase family protein n=1 Tax=Nostoc sp. 106C TaxID=1932667 RepID=UPI000A3A100B|nr:acylneuraminate cytidylyltransferase family protein [Nostoc sp. 106C]OUL24492.1 acylneuraminate cytidylyltransferase [Nostoc sp. RF31YmG]OUL30013.1 acylneuraminate cytidylyltransferase [Nostoc sp. 106C]